MKKARKLIHILIILLVVIQLFAYLGSINMPDQDLTDFNAAAYYIGFNIMLIIAFVLLVISLYLRRKIKMNENNSHIDSIGEE